MPKFKSVCLCSAWRVRPTHRLTDAHRQRRCQNYYTHHVRDVGCKDIAMHFQGKSRQAFELDLENLPLPPHPHLQHRSWLGHLLLDVLELVLESLRPCFTCTPVREIIQLYSHNWYIFADRNLTGISQPSYNNLQL